jgi:hypothetical protein
MLDLMSREKKIYLCYDSPWNANSSVDTPVYMHTLEFLNTTVSFGLLKSEVKIKSWGLSIVDKYCRDFRIMQCYTIDNNKNRKICP